VAWRWPADVRSQICRRCLGLLLEPLFFSASFLRFFLLLGNRFGHTHFCHPTCLNDVISSMKQHTKIEERGDINVHHRHQYAKWKSRKAVNQPNRNQFSDNYVPPRNIKTNK
jgi:hypothetical protein